MPLPGPARIHPGNTFKALDAGYMTDQRSFSNLSTASHRMQSKASVDLSMTPPRLVASGHTTSGTTEVGITTGIVHGTAPANMSRCRWGALTQVAAGRAVSVGSVRVPFGGTVPLNAGFIPSPHPTFSLSVVAAAGDPLVSAAADIDYEGTFTITLLPGAVEVSFDGKLDSFPAFESYASLRGVTKTLFTSAPPPGNTVMSLPGRANRPVSGSVRFP